MKRRPSNPLSSGFSLKFVAPAGVGAAFAITKAMVVRQVSEEAALQTDFQFLLLEGILYGFLLRFWIQRIFWTRLVALCSCLLTLTSVGMLAKLIEIKAMQGSAATYGWMMALPEVSGLVTAVGLSVLIFRPRQVMLDLPALMRRLKKLMHRSRGWAWLVMALWLPVVFNLFAGLFPVIDENQRLFCGLSQGGFDAVSCLESSLWLSLQSLVWLVGLSPLLVTLRGRFHEELIVLFVVLFLAYVMGPALGAPFQVPAYWMMDQMLPGLFICSAYLLVLLKVTASWRPPL